MKYQLFILQSSIIKIFPVTSVLLVKVKISVSLVIYYEKLRKHMRYNDLAARILVRHPLPTSFHFSFSTSLVT